MIFGGAIRLVTEPVLKTVEVLKPLGVRLPLPPFNKYSYGGITMTKFTGKYATAIRDVMDSLGDEDFSFYEDFQVTKSADPTGRAKIFFGLILGSFFIKVMISDSSFSIGFLKVVQVFPLVLGVMP